MILFRHLYIRIIVGTRYAEETSPKTVNTQTKITKTICIFKISGFIIEKINNDGFIVIKRVYSSPQNGTDVSANNKRSKQQPVRTTGRRIRSYALRKSVLYEHVYTHVYASKDDSKHKQTKKRLLVPRRPVPAQYTSEIITCHVVRGHQPVSLTLGGHRPLVPSADGRGVRLPRFQTATRYDETVFAYIIIITHARTIWKLIQ